MDKMGKKSPNKGMWQVFIKEFKTSILSLVVDLLSKWNKISEETTDYPTLMWISLMGLWTKVKIV